MATSSTHFVHPDEDEGVSVGFHTVGDDLWVTLVAGDVDMRVCVDRHQLDEFHGSLVHTLSEIIEQMRGYA